jgi:hypothetical protein
MNRRTRQLMRAIRGLTRRRRMVSHIIPFPFTCAVMFGGKSLEMRTQAIFYDPGALSKPFEMTEIKMTGTISNADVDALFDMFKVPQ